MEKQVISPKQFGVFVTVFIIGSAILYSPQILVGEAKQDAWIAGILGLIGGVLLASLYGNVANKMSNRTFLQFNEYVLGKVLGKVFFTLFIYYSFIITSLLLRSIGEFLTTQIMPDTPIEATYIFFMLIVIVGTRYGIETITRSAEIFFPWIFSLFLFLIIFLIPEMEITKIQPVFEGGVKPILRSALPFLSFPFLESVLLILLFQHITQAKKAGKAFIIGTLVGGLFLVIITLASILVLGPDFTARNTFPTYILGKKVSIGEFLERVEVLIAIIWFLSMYFMTTACFYISTIGLATILKLKEHKILTFPLAMVLIVYGLKAGENTVEFQEFNAKIWPMYALSWGFIYPIVLLLGHKLKGSKTNE